MIRRDRSGSEAKSMACAACPPHLGAMSFRPIVTALACLVALFVGGCAAYSSDIGPDSLSNSEASIVTWTDGEAAIAITCLKTRGCSQRARAMCRLGYLEVLHREKPSPPAADDTAPPAQSIVVRCS